MLQKYLKTYTLHTTHNMKDYNYEIGIICSKIFLDMGGTFRQNHNKVHGEIEEARARVQKMAWGSCLNRQWARLGCFCPFWTVRS